MLVHSMAGGTGSGLGAALMQALRAAYPLHFLAAVAVAAHASGEVPLQHYNTTLCAAVQQRTCDAVLLFNNDDLLASCMSGAGAGTQPSSLPAMNHYAASCLAGVLAPSPAHLLTSLARVCQWASPAPQWRYAELQSYSAAGVLSPAALHSLRAWLPRPRRHTSGARVCCPLLAIALHEQARACSAHLVARLPDDPEPGCLARLQKVCAVCVALFLCACLLGDRCIGPSPLPSMNAQAVDALPWSCEDNAVHSWRMHKS